MFIISKCSFIQFKKSIFNYLIICLHLFILPKRMSQLQTFNKKLVLAFLIYINIFKYETKNISIVIDNNII